MDPYVYVEKANLSLMKDESVRDFEASLRAKINEDLSQLRPPSPGGGPPSNLWIEYLYADRAIVEGYNPSVLKHVTYEVPYKRDSKGVFTLGKPAEVEGRKVFVPVSKAVWTRAYINDLPDSAFLFVETGGKKDEENKTVPRSLRHFPYKDDMGKIDLPHLRNAIARMPQSKIPGMTADKLRRLQEKAQGILEKENEKLERETKEDKKKRLESLGFEAIPSPLWEGLPV